ncbi:MAG TPA: hypothetical protein VG318_19265 [Actinomycetota bacterium]|nr:hypothetical protein [Actinomycetota bacterium]
MIKKPAILFAAVLLALAGIACDSGGGKTERELSDALLTAAEATEDAGTGRIEITSEVSVGEQDITLEASGEFDFANDTGHMTMSGAGAGLPGVGEMEMIVDGEYMYVKGPAFEAALEGKEWGRIDLSAAGTTGAGQFNQDPTQYLEWLRVAGANVEEAGEEDIDGTPTTHYKAEISVDSIVEQAPDEETAQAIRSSFAVFGDVDALPVEVWVDEDDLPRRMTVSIDGSGETPVSTHIAMDFVEFGIPVDVEAPESFTEIAGFGS